MTPFFYTGKTLTAARTVDIPRSAYNFRFFASSVLHHTSDCSQMDHMGCLNYTTRCPVGVGGISACFNIRQCCLSWSVKLWLLVCGSWFDQSLEPPSVPADVEDRACHCYGQHGGGQAQRDDLSDRVDALQTDAAGG